MKKLLLLLFISVTFQLQAQTFVTQYDQLVSVNQQWKYQPDVNPSLKTTEAKPLSEQQLVQLHLQEVEKLLRKREISHLSSQLKQQRQRLLDVLHGYIEVGVFPINNLQQERQPYFIDKYNTYCAVGYLMKMCGADKMARDIYNTQNFSYLFDIKHPQLLEWANGSGFTLAELALIQPSYGGEVPTTLTEMHYNNAGTDVNEYIEIRQSTGQLIGMPRFDSVIFVNATGVVYKRLPISSMAAGAYNSFYYYTFPT
jgi:hypothetical protein